MGFHKPFKKKALIPWVCEKKPEKKGKNSPYNYYTGYQNGEGIK